MCAQQPMLFKGFQGRIRIAEHRSLTQSKGMRHKNLAQYLGGLVNVDPFDVFTTGRKHPNGRVGVAIADRIGQRADGFAEAVRRHQSGNRAVDDGGQTFDQVGKHGPGLDRGQLIRVADQQQAGIGTNGLQQSRHHGQRHHGGLIDDDHVVRQTVLPVVPEPRRGVGPAAQQPVQRGGRQGGQAFPVGGGECIDFKLHGLE